MSDLILERFCDSADHGTFGVISFRGSRQCNTVERPWLDNIPFKSCIPAGRYRLIPFHRLNGQDVYALVNEDLRVYLTKEDMDEAGGQGRYAILIHIANYIDDVVGCIGPGDHWTWSSDKNCLMVTSSRTTTAKLMRLISSKQIDAIEIIWKHH